MAAAAAALLLVPAPNAAAGPGDEVGFEPRSLDGSGNNRSNPALGAAGGRYLRQAPSAYADGRSALTVGPEPRRVSNRIFADLGQNVFSPRAVTQWAWVWGQFLDHTIGLKQVSETQAPITFDPDDPLERFRNDLGAIGFTRSAPASGTGVTSPREQVNLVSSYLDAWSVYGGTDERLDWLRVGPLDGDPTNNGAELLLDSDGYLPRATERGDAVDAPMMELDGRLRGNADARAVAGDVRANENIALTATHTLFAREHNRIVRQLPANLPEQQKFEIARRVIAALQQYITYEEFLPAMGVRLSTYKGYRPDADPSVGNEFATAAYRAHTQVHGEIEMEVPAGTYTPAQLAAFEGQGIEVDLGPDGVGLAVPLNIAYFNPDLVEQIGIGPILAGVGEEAQYRNDELIDDQLRSVLFQLPRPGAPDPSACLDGADLPDCFQGVVDLGAIDIQRGRDHGIARYNDLRRSFGLQPVRSFSAMTGERSAGFPRGMDTDDPRSVKFTKLFDAAGHRLEPGSEAADTTTVRAVRRSTLAARLKALYGRPGKVDGFVGIFAEPPVRGSELGELGRAIWADQFERLRDADRFFYRNDPALERIRRDYGIDYRRSLAQVIEANSDADVDPRVFRTEWEGAAAPATGSAGRKQPHRHCHRDGPGNEPRKRTAKSCPNTQGAGGPRKESRSATARPKRHDDRRGRSASRSRR